jgi:hypothetical protein
METKKPGLSVSNGQPIRKLFFEAASLASIWNKNERIRGPDKTARNRKN